MGIIELYGAETGNCLRAAIALEEAGIAFHARPLDLRNGEHKSSGYLALDPSGRVPTLVDGGVSGEPFVLTQSNAIIFYAADMKPGTILAASQGPERTRAIERFFYFVTDVIAPSHAAFFLRPANEGAAAALLDARSLEALRSAEDFLADGAHMAGTRFSIADISALTIVGSMSGSIPWTEMPRLRQWYARVSGRPGVVAGLRAFEKVARGGS